MPSRADPQRSPARTVRRAGLRLVGPAASGGLGFALVRIVVKKFFPGKVFDRRKTMEVIQLGLSDRPVNMKDFY